MPRQPPTVQGSWLHRHSNLYSIPPLLSQSISPSPSPISRCPSHSPFLKVNQGRLPQSISSDWETSLPLYAVEPPFPCKWLTSIVSLLVPVQGICYKSPQHGIACLLFVTTVSDNTSLVFHHGYRPQLWDERLFKAHMRCLIRMVRIIMAQYFH